MRLTDEKLKEFRANVSRLKKAGLIPAKNRNGNPVIVRNARPSQLVQGKTLGEWVRSSLRDPSAKDVLSGKAVVLPASRVKDTEGFRKIKVKGGTDRVVIPVPKDARVSTEKGKIVITHVSDSGSIRRVQVPRKDLQGYLTGVSQLPELKGGDVYAFYMNGGKSMVMSAHPDLLIEELQQYKRFETDDPSDILQHLEIVTVSKSAKPAWKREVEERVRQQRRGSRTRPERRRIENIPEFKRPAHRAKKAAAQRKRRARK